MSVNVMRTMTVRQMRGNKTRTMLTLLETTVVSCLLSAVLMGGTSLVASIGPNGENVLVILVKMAAAIVSVVLLVCAAVLLRGAFSVSLSQRVRALGQLASIGATRRQLRASVYWEAALLGVIAIPAGMLFAALGLFVTFQILNHIPAVTRLIEPLRLTVSASGLAFCALWSALALFFAAVKPARAAFRLNPIQSMSGGNRRGKARRAKAWNPAKPPEAQLAKRGLAQDAARRRTLCASMAVSLALILIAAGFSSTLRTAYNASAPAFSCRLYVFGNYGTYPEEMMTEAQEMFPDIPSVRVEISEMSTSEVGDDRKFIHYVLYVLEDDDFAAWYGGLLTPEEGTVPYVTSLADTQLPEGAELRELPVYSTAGRREAGTCDTPLPLRIGESTRYADWSDGQKIAATNRTAFEHALPEVPVTINRSFAVYYDTDDGFALEQAISERFTISNTLGNDVIWQDYSRTSTWAARRTAVTLLVNVFSWGFVALVLLVSSISLVGTVSADLALRRRQFALLISAGMTQGQLDTMLRRQCLSYCAGLPVGLLFGAWVCATLARMFKLSFWQVFSIPAAVLGGALLVGICLLALHSSRDDLARLSVVEALREGT